MERSLWSTLKQHLQEQWGLTLGNPMLQLRNVYYYACTRLEDQSVFTVCVQNCGDSLDSVKEVAEMLLELKDEFIVEVYCYSWFVFSRQHFFVLICEHCGNDVELDLRLRTENGNRWTEEELWPIILGLVETLSRVEEKGFVHCDICPQNLLMTRDGRVKLGRWDCARRVTADPGELQMGAPTYSCPIIKRKQNTMHANETTCDLVKSTCYSLGLTLLTMIHLSLPQEFTTLDHLERKTENAIQLLTLSDNIKDVFRYMLCVSEERRCRFSDLMQQMYASVPSDTRSEIIENTPEVKVDRGDRLIGVRQRSSTETSSQQPEEPSISDPAEINLSVTEKCVHPNCQRKIDASSPMPLCEGNHRFCSYRCLNKYVKAYRGQRRQPTCPICHTRINDDALRVPRPRSFRCCGVQ